ncbi:MAG: hypothetical protein V4697_01295 [Patescibacteria group bacterium]
MKDTLILQDKIYISAKRVHEIFGYTSDYVGQLCRAGKLEARMVGRSWFVTEKSVADHKIEALKVLNPRIALAEAKALSNQGFKMATLSMVCAVLLLSFLFTSVSSQTLVTASFGSVSQEIVRAFLGLFTRTASHTAVAPLPVKPVAGDWNGIAVVPSQGSRVADEALEKKIRDSFSDEVIVSMDADRNSGVITPVFKKSQGEDFLYVLVPVGESP